MTGRQQSTVRRDGSFDAIKVAARRAALAGTIDAATLPRVADRLANGEAKIVWRIAGVADLVGRPALEVSLDGVVPLECQRCLRSFAWPVAQRTVLLLARDEAELARLDEGDLYEVILAAAPLDPVALVEDELLLTLPFAPHCERDDCASDMATMAARAGAAELTPRASAFGVLAGLKPGPAKKTRR